MFDVCVLLLHRCCSETVVFWLVVVSEMEAMEEVKIVVMIA